jgi:hypothetical protein
MFNIYVALGASFELWFKIVEGTYCSKSVICLYMVAAVNTFLWRGVGVSAQPALMGGGGERGEGGLCTQSHVTCLSSEGLRGTSML